MNTCVVFIITFTIVGWFALIGALVFAHGAISIFIAPMSANQPTMVNVIMKTTHVFIAHQVLMTKTACT
jgi:hypothetical protein